MRKKGQVATIGPAIMALIIAGIFLILGLVILQSIRDTDVIDQAVSGSVSNERLTTVTEAGESVAGATAPGFNAFTVTTVTNATSGTAIPSTNYTVGTAGTVSFTSGNSLGINNSDWNVTYTYLAGGEAYTDTNATLVGLATFADFWEIIVLAIVITVVIGLLLVVFGGRRAR